MRSRRLTPTSVRRPLALFAARARRSSAWAYAQTVAAKSIASAARACDLPKLERASQYGESL
eukprot:13508240-Alexandrium_andersonii.AAC.1